MARVREGHGVREYYVNVQLWRTNLNVRVICHTCIYVATYYNIIVSLVIHVVHNIHVVHVHMYV